MALPKKGSRNITVQNKTYCWMVSGNDNWVNLYIELKDAKGPLLKAKFEYHFLTIPQENGKELKQLLSVTPDIVKQTIELGLKVGWNPISGEPLNLHHIDDRIEWKMDQN